VKNRRQALGQASAKRAMHYDEKFYCRIVDTRGEVDRQKKGDEERTRKQARRGPRSGRRKWDRVRVGEGRT
jgi:hypothetical protein